MLYRRMHNWKSKTKPILIALLCVTLFLCGYLASWSVKYRIPCSPVKVIDLRISPTDRPYCVSFCASLANNPTGFPGHACVVLSPSINVDPDRDLSYGLMPKRFRDQFASLFTYVPAALLENVRGNTRNLDRLTVIVSKSDFENAKCVALGYGAFRLSDTFKAGERDCVSFTDFVAKILGLRTPPEIQPSKSHYLFPQDYLRRLKELN